MVEALRSFRMGGVHPPDAKLTREGAVSPLPLPKEVSILLTQHIGAPATPIVEKGHRVLAGQLIAEKTGFVSANVHSSVSGTVQRIAPIHDASGYPRMAIHIAVEGDEWAEGIIRRGGQATFPEGMAPSEMLNRIHQAGIVGMGGAAFPSHVKLTIPQNKRVEYIVINGVECEPYLTSDDRLMRERGEELVVGLQILRAIMGPVPVIVGIEANKPEAIDSLGALAQKHEWLRIQPLRLKYPQGGEKQLIDACVQRQVPAGKLPLDVGCVVHNVGTVFAVYEAVCFNKPLVERIVTVSGSGVARPGNYQVRIGTHVSYLLEQAGWDGLLEGKIISGGPMMGKTLKTVDSPIAKGTSGILLLRGKAASRPEPQQCIRCARCVSACPMGLEPHLLYRLGERAMLDELEHQDVMTCIECGSCSFTCPAGLPLLDYIRLSKVSVGAAIRARNLK